MRYMRLDIDGNGNSNASEQMLVAYSGSENEDREREKDTHTESRHRLYKKRVFQVIISQHCTYYPLAVLSRKKFVTQMWCSCSCSLHDAEPTNFGMAGTGSVFFL